MNRFLVVKFFVLILLFVPLLGQAQISNGTYELESSVVSAGGGTLSVGNYQIDVVTGETFIGRVTNAVYDIFVGFLKPTTACSDGVDNDGDGFVDLLDTGCADADDDNEYVSSGGSGGNTTPTEPTGTNNPTDPETFACNLVANPSVIQEGEQSQLIWSGSGLASSGHTITGLGVVPSAGVASVSPTTTTDYIGNFIDTRGDTLTCSYRIEVQDSSAGFVDFSPSTYQLIENIREHLVVLERQGGSSGAVSVLVDIAGSPIAQAGADFIFIPTVVTWQAGEQGTKTVQFSVIDDNLIEGPEFVELQLKNIAGALYGANRSATIQIVDDEVVLADPVLTLVTTVDNRGVGTRAAHTFGLTLNGSTVTSGQSVSVPKNTELVIEGQNETDYRVSSVTGSSFCPERLGETFELPEGVNVVCRINYEYTGNPNPEETDPDPETDPDNGPDPDPKIEVDIDLGSGSVSQITLVEATLRISEATGQAVIALERSGSLALPVEANLMLIPGTALLGADYGQTDSVVRWGEKEGGVKTLVIPISVDDIPEVDEYFTVALSSLTSGIFGRNTRTRVTISDDTPEEVASDQATGAVLTQLETFVESPTIKSAIVTTAATSLSVGVTAFVTSVAVNPGMFADLLSLPFRLYSLLLSFFGIRKKNRPWGVVFDSFTKQPLDPAHVIIRNEAGQEIATSITDLDGRYGFLVNAGKYRIEAGKTHYTFPSVQLAGKTSDELYDRLYFGEEITVATDGEVLLHNIPMDPEQEDWNQKAKIAMGVTRFYNKHSVAIALVTDVLFYVGVTMATVATIIAPARYNIIILIAYGVLMILRVIGLKIKSHGRVIEAKTGDPIPGAVLKFFSQRTGIQVAKRTTDSMGRYYALINKGVYRVDIETTLPDGSVQKIGSFQNLKTKKGIIRKFFKL